MSTSWDLHCPEHNERASFDWNHGDEEIALVWRNRVRLIELWDASQGDAVFEIDDIRLAGNYEPLRYDHVHFLRDHGDHRLELVNEYGDRKLVDTMQPIPPRHCASCTCEAR